MYKGIIFRDILAVAFIVFILAWFTLVAYLIKMVGVNELEALGLGAATGVFLKSFSDMWQFYFRKAPKEETEGK